MALAFLVDVFPDDFDWHLFQMPFFLSFDKLENYRGNKNEGFYYHNRRLQITPNHPNLLVSKWLNNQS